MTVPVSLCLFGVNEVKVKKKKTRYYVVLERAQGPTLLDCNYADACFTVSLGSVLAGCYTQVPHYINRLRALVLREDLKSICPLSSCSLLFPKMAGKSTEFSRTHILRDAPRFTGEQAHMVDYKENWMPSYSSTAVPYGTYEVLRASAAREVRAYSR